MAERYEYGTICSVQVFVISIVVLLFGSLATGKDLMWYARDGKQTAAEAAASAREEIERVKQEEEEAMRVTHLQLIH